MMRVVPFAKCRSLLSTTSPGPQPCLIVTTFGPKTVNKMSGDRRKSYVSVAVCLTKGERWQVVVKRLKHQPRLTANHMRCVND